MQSPIQCLVQPELVFPVWLFVLSSLINLLFLKFKVVGKTTMWLNRRLAEEILQFLHWSAGPGADQAVEREKRLLQINEEIGPLIPFGRTIGGLETEIYLYALFSSNTSILTAVVVFKAFFTWVKPVRDDLALPENHRSIMQVGRYYHYITGNFASLGWAIIIYEAVKALARYHAQIVSSLTLSG